MRHFWQWFCGYICVCVKGRQVNRFLNLCSKNGIQLWRINYDIEHSLRANLRLRDFYDIKPYLRKTKTKLRIISKKGFPFWCHRHPKLKWFLSIVFCLCCIGIYSLNFVWKIEVKGNEKVSTQEILDCLQENEINVGLKREEVDCSKIEWILREQFQQLGWVSVYFENIQLCVEVKESLYDVLGDSQTEEGKSYHLVANKDAVISSIVTRAGNALVKAGQSVKKGDILVLGQNEIFDDSGEIKNTLYFQADALIFGEVMYDIELPLSELEIMGLKISGNYNDSMLLKLGYQKVDFIIQKMSKNGVIVIDKNIKLQKNERKISFQVKIYTREQIGINIPVEEVRENEFE